MEGIEARNLQKAFASHLPALKFFVNAEVLF